MNRVPRPLLTMKHLISLKDYTKQDLLEILELAIRLKKKPTSEFDGKTLLMLFQKTSTRTRISFEVAAYQLGGHGLYIDSRQTQLNLSDFRDEIRAIMGFGDMLMFRALRADDVEFAASLNMIPVIDACSEKYHPCQALGDILTMMEHAGSIEDIGRVGWLGIENNVSNTLKIACATLGIPLSIVVAEKDIDSVDQELNQKADASGFISYSDSVETGLKGVRYVHTDTWMNMEFFENGKIRDKHKDEFERRKKTFLPYQLNAKILDTIAPNSYAMHCMPCHVGYEISRDAIDHPRSLIFKQAQNRLHIQKAIMVWLMRKTLK